MVNDLPENRAIIGITTGDINGIGIELIIKTFSDARMMELCTPVIFGSNKALNFYRKIMGDINFPYQSIRDFTKLVHKHINLFTCWDEEVLITPGLCNETGGKYAIRSLMVATQCLTERSIQGLVTAPLSKANIQGPDFRYTGHTPFLRDAFGARDVLMLMVAESLKVGLVTEHIPIAEIAGAISKETVLSKIFLLKDCLVRDFGIEKPRIAVLGLNPHAGDGGLIGTEEKKVLEPAIQDARNSGLLCFGPFSADGFFGRQHYREFSAVLSLYHDQGLIPFKSLSPEPGVNYTAGLPVVRTSPDHGTAFDIAGKNLGDERSFRQAVFTCVDILRNRRTYEENTRNPLKKSELISE